MKESTPSKEEETPKKPTCPFCQGEVIFPEFKENQIKKRKKKIVGFDLRQNRTYYYHIESTLEDSYLVSCYENNKISDFQKSFMNLNEYMNRLKTNITPNPYFLQEHIFHSF